MKIERKSFEIKAATLDDNCLKGAASVVGVMDRGRDVIFPGAWDKTLKGFLANGFVAVGHAWDQLPVAMPTLVKATGNQLYTEAIFHTTTAAQDARTVCKERLSQDLSVGLSVGFLLAYGDENHPPYQYFETGQKLLDFAKANGYDMTLFDAKGIKACKSYCRGILNIDELMEYSIVTVPCNQEAVASEAKSSSRPGEPTAYGGITPGEPTAYGGITPENAVLFDATTIVTERDFEAYLRDAGYSRKDATAITLHGFKAFSKADALEPTSNEPVGNLQRDAEGAGDEPAETTPELSAAETEEAKSLEAASLEEAAQTNRLALDALSLRTLSLRMDALRS